MASLVAAPVQRNRRTENAQLKDGEVPADWSEAKRRQKDVEARWTQNGAKCLNTPRIEASQYAPGLAVFPDVVASIAAECSIPACDDPPTADELMGYHLLSANPP